MIYFVDQDKMRRKTITQIHSDNPCSTGGCEGIDKDLRVKQPPRRIDAEGSIKLTYCKSNTGKKNFEA